MKKIFQDLRNGKTILEEIPAPSKTKNKITIQSYKSLISPGTEKMLMNFGKANYLQKALQQPDKVKQVVNKIKSDGIVPTFNAVQDKLSKPIPLGYSNVGKVIRSSVAEFKIGDRVVSNGPHAEVITVSPNLCCKIPDDVNFETASFTVLGSIALQGIRRIEPTIGETVVVVGLGVIGNLSCQILAANGCKVIAIDPSEERCKIARDIGINSICLDPDENYNQIISSFNNEEEVDAVLITASSKSKKITNFSAEICRKRGRIVLIGVVGLDLDRDLFYKKEILFSVSSAYGPGRYDTKYEEENLTYPIGFVRWTAKRNFSFILDLMSENKINVLNLISNQFSFEQVNKAYQLLKDVNTMTVLINYSETVNLSDTVEVVKKNKILPDNSLNDFAFIGAGDYASKILLPQFKKNKVNIKYIASLNGENAQFLSKKYNIQYNTTNIDQILTDQTIKNVIISTRHDSHAELVCKFLDNGKNVFVEKPLAISLNELKRVKNSFENSSGSLMVGFNRRFSPISAKIKELLKNNKAPLAININVNSGIINRDHWTQNKSIGGGRLIGEGIHFLDYIQFLVSSKVSTFSVSTMENNSYDTFSINLKYTNGSICNLNYFSNGNSQFPKEKIEIYTEGKILEIDNFKSLKGYGFQKFNKLKLWKQDKGNERCIKEYINFLNGKSFPIISYDDLFYVSELCINIANSENL